MRNNTFGCTSPDCAGRSNAIRCAPSTFSPNRLLGIDLENDTPTSFASMNRLRAALIWGGVLAATTVALYSARDVLDKAHIALVLLLVVLGASAAGGRALGLVVAGASFFLFDFVFLEPYGSLVISNPFDWLVLVAFLATSVVAAQLLFRAQEQTERARLRATEVDRLATLGAEALNATKAVDAVAAVAAVLRSVTGVASCDIFLTDDARDPGAGELAAWVAQNGAPALELEDGTTRLGEQGMVLPELIDRHGTPVRALLVPLRVQNQSVGVLRLSGPIAFDAARWRFLDALSYYAALAAERVRLSAAADHADALRDADRLKDALIASVSHDLRTPLTTIKALAHDMSALGDERAQMIEVEADRLNRFVRDLLDLSRLSAGALPLQIELNAVDELIGAALQGVEGLQAAHRINVELPKDGALLIGRFDLSYAIRVLVNLIENALKYSPSDGAVSVIAHREGARLLISISDQGSGVAVAERESVFTPFYRTPDAPSDAGSVGLGLSIARRLAEAQGGTVTYAERDGGGSVFTLQLPAADLNEALANAEMFVNR